MKLVGSSKGKRTINGQKNDTAPASHSSEYAPSSAYAPTTPHAANNGKGNKGTKKKMSTSKKLLVIACSLLGVVALILGATFIVLRWEVQPFYDIFFPRPDESILAPLRTPSVPSDPENPNNNDPAGPNAPSTPQVPIEELRNMNKITFLVLGIDGYKGMRSEGGANTDAIMVATFDMEKLTMEVASIPRDTIVNVPWNVKKVNSIYATMRGRHQGNNALALAMEDTKAHFADILGFNIDHWITLDLAGFEALVNAMPGGGVVFNVPSTIRLQDPDIGLNVVLYPGTQTLNGKQAIAAVRYRGYSNSDFGRMDVQQQFLMAVATQLLSQPITASQLTTYLEVFIKHVNTDMDLNYLTRIAREMIKMNTENINFSAMHATVYTVRGVGAGSYVYIDTVEDWLKIVNDKLNPWYHEITKAHVSILTLDERGNFYVTDENWQGSKNWGR